MVPRSLHVPSDHDKRNIRSPHYLIRQELSEMQVKCSFSQPMILCSSKIHLFLDFYGKMEKKVCVESLRIVLFRREGDGCGRGFWGYMFEDERCYVKIKRLCQKVFYPPKLLRHFVPPPL